MLMHVSHVLSLCRDQPNLGLLSLKRMAVLAIDRKRSHLYRFSVEWHMQLMQWFPGKDACTERSSDWWYLRVMSGPPPSLDPISPTVPCTSTFTPSTPQSATTHDASVTCQTVMPHPHATKKQYYEAKFGTKYSNGASQTHQQLSCHVSIVFISQVVLAQTALCMAKQVQCSRVTVSVVNWQQVHIQGGNWSSWCRMHVQHQ